MREKEVQIGLHVFKKTLLPAKLSMILTCTTTKQKKTLSEEGTYLRRLHLSEDSLCNSEENLRLSEDGLYSSEESLHLYEERLYLIEEVYIYLKKACT